MRAYAQAGLKAVQDTLETKMGGIVIADITPMFLPFSLVPRMGQCVRLSGRLSGLHDGQLKAHLEVFYPPCCIYLNSFTT